MENKIYASKIQVLIAGYTLNDCILKECPVLDIFPEFFDELLSIIKRGDYFKVFISIYDNFDRMIYGDTYDYRSKIELAEKINNIIVEANKILENEV